MLTLWRTIKSIFVNDAHQIISERGKQILSEEEEWNNYNPYCPICQSCGVDGCCSAISCQLHPDGSHCETYKKDLKFAYKLNKKFFEHIYDNLPEDLKEKYDKIWDEEWDVIYDNKNKKKENE